MERKEADGKKKRAYMTNGGTKGKEGKEKAGRKKEKDRKDQRRKENEGCSGVREKAR